MSMYAGINEMKQNHLYVEDWLFSILVFLTIPATIPSYLRTLLIDLPRCTIDVCNTLLAGTFPFPMLTPSVSGCFAFSCLIFTPVTVELCDVWCDFACLLATTEQPWQSTKLWVLFLLLWPQFSLKYQVLHVDGNNTTMTGIKRT